MRDTLSAYDFLAGSAGGVCGIIFSHPMDTIKTRQQLTNHSIFAITTHTYKHQGFKGFFKGMLLPLLASTTSNSIFFGIYGNMFRTFQNSRGSNVSLLLENKLGSQLMGTPDLFNWYKDVFWAGCLGGVGYCVIACPTELIKTRIQRHVTTRTVDIRGMIANISRLYGLRGLYRGMMPLLCRDVPTYGAYMVVYERLLNFELAHYPENVAIILASVIGGWSSWAFVLPLDVVKSRMQADSLSNPQYKGMTDCFRKIIKEEGVYALFRGWWMVTIRSIPVSIATFWAYEKMLQLLNKHP